MSFRELAQALRFLEILVEQRQRNVAQVEDGHLGARRSRAGHRDLQQFLFHDSVRVLPANARIFGVRAMSASSEFVRDADGEPAPAR